MNRKLMTTLFLGAVAVSTLQGCFPMVATGLTTGLLAAVDRRTVGAQTEDESIEWKAAARVREQLGDKAHLNFTSYNRKVLITGEAISSEIRFQAENVTARIPNVLGVYNEVVVGPSSSFVNRSSDAFITSKIKSRSLDSQKFSPIHVKVVTEANVAFLLGIVTQEEAEAAIGVARTTAGVKKVVNLLEVVTPGRAKELDQMNSGTSGETSETPTAQAPREDKTDGTP
ncbi:MAG: BON domain-containing protein [Candidatus Accumulibacter sp.]|jgi:osmotically-inducible protein OsmY|nr:BON domain-containing protein [Accumulibacter sp.]